MKKLLLMLMVCLAMTSCCFASTNSVAAWKEKQAFRASATRVIKKNSTYFKVTGKAYVQLNKSKSYKKMKDTYMKKIPSKYKCVLWFWNGKQWAFHTYQYVNANKTCKKVGDKLYRFTAAGEIKWNRTLSGGYQYRLDVEVPTKKGWQPVYAYKFKTKK